MGGAEMKANDSPESHYWKIGPVYVKKIFLLTMIAAASIAVLAKFGLPTELFPAKDPAGDYRYDDPALLELSEEVQIRDKNGVVRYEGPVDKGVCTGKGRVYDANGKLCYEGMLKENQYEGDDAKVYKNDRLIYVGSMRDNQYNGPGTRYDYQLGEVYRGEFMNGMEEGNIQIFDLNGQKLGEGYFVSGKEQRRFLIP